jgi:nucleoside-diphosphate-sugar epimerase
MRIAIIGAAGMIGRKLTARLVADGGLGGRGIKRLTLVDVIEPLRPEGFNGKVKARARDLSTHIEDELGGRLS